MGQARHKTTVVDDDYFSNLAKADESKAYILGILDADGSVPVRDRLISFSLKEEDGYLVQQIHDLMGTNVKVSISEWRGFKKYRFSITSPKIVKDLRSLDFKTGLIPPIPTELMPHWIRGYFDGNGCIYPYKGRMFATFVSRLECQMYNIEDYLARHANMRKQKVYSKFNSDRCWEIRYGIEDTKKLGQYMYAEATVWMKRKRKRFNI